MTDSCLVNVQYCDKGSADQYCLSIPNPILNRIFGMEGEGQYVGDEAAEWFSKYMNKPGFKMYQLSRPRVIREHDEWSDIGEAGDKVK